MHGFLIDSARAMERPNYYRRVLRFMADQGLDTVLWHFNDDQGCSLVFDHLPQAASPHALSKDQMRELIAYAHGLGLEVIPELATYGHTRYITTLPEYAHLREGDAEYSGICPVLPETRALLAKLIEEVADLFESDWLHVGMDEVVVGSHPATAEALKHRTAGQLYVEHARFVHQQVTAHGKRMIMWGDHLVAEPALLDELPRDIVVAPWYYSPNAEASLVRPMLSRGFDVLLCGALSCSPQGFLPGEANTLPNLCSTRRLELDEHPGPGRIIGQITTIWTPTRYMHDALWPGMHLAAKLLTGSSEIDTRQEMSAFGRSFFGFHKDSPAIDGWGDAMAEVLALSPCRKDWLALLNAQPLPDEPLSHEVLAQRWLQAYESLNAARALVTDNLRSFDTFLLAVDVMASLHARALDLSAGRLDQAIATTQRLIAEVETVWDIERYPDDPRKSEAAWDRDRTESLIMQLHAGLAGLQS